MNKHGWVVAAAALGCGTGHSAFEDDGNVSAQREAVTLNDLNGRCWRISTVFGAQEVGAGGSTYMQFRYLDANTVTRLADTRSHQRNDTQRWCFSGSVVPAVGGTGGGPGDLALGLLRHRRMQSGRGSCEKRTAARSCGRFNTPRPEANSFCIHLDSRCKPISSCTPTLRKTTIASGGERAVPIGPSRNSPSAPLMNCTSLKQTALVPKRLPSQNTVGRCSASRRPITATECSRSRDNPCDARARRRRRRRGRGCGRPPLHPSGFARSLGTSCCRRREARIRGARSIRGC
jgi:hypothetical protein